MRLDQKDRDVIYAFVDRYPMDGDKLSTDGKSLDGHWIGGNNIAEWVRGGPYGKWIVFNDLGSRAAQSVQRVIKSIVSPSVLSDDGFIYKHKKRYKR